MYLRRLGRHKGPRCLVMNAKGVLWELSRAAAAAATPHGRVLRDRPGTAGRERPGTEEVQVQAQARLVRVPNAPLPNANNPYANRKANASKNASKNAIMYPFAFPILGPMAVRSATYLPKSRPDLRRICFESCMKSRYKSVMTSH